MATSLDLAGSRTGLLKDLFREHLPGFLWLAASQGSGLPRHVRRELEHFLVCGDPASGFAWLQCRSCDHHRLVPFSCKGRGFCPSCGGRRMAAFAARMVEQVLPCVPVRQWVLTLPWDLRLLLAHRHDLARGVLRIAFRVIQGFYRGRNRTCGQPLTACTGAVTVMQRFGTDLRLNPHFHMLVLDGSYSRVLETGELRFHKSPAPSTAEVAAVVEEIAVRAAHWLIRQGVRNLEEPDPDDLQLCLQAAAAAGVAALGPRAGRRARRVQRLGGRVVRLPPRCATIDGFNLHAGVIVPASDRKGLERICRYLARPPLARERLERNSEGDVVLGFKRAWSDGTTGVVLSPGELLQRLAALVPPPGRHTVLYHGVLASHAAWRAEVVPVPPRRRCHGSLRSPKLAPAAQPIHRLHWADLLARVFEVDGFACPHCDGRMTLRAVVLPGTGALRVLDGLQHAARGPPGRLVPAA